MNAWPMGKSLSRGMPACTGADFALITAVGERCKVRKIEGFCLSKATVDVDAPTPILPARPLLVDETANGLWAPLLQEASPSFLKNRHLT